MYSETFWEAARAKPSLNMSSPVFRQITDNQEDRCLYESATQELYALTPDSNPAKKHSMLKASINGRVPKPWMSMIRPTKARHSPGQSTAPARQQDMLHSHSAIRSTSQPPQSEASSTSDTVESAQLACFERQAQSAPDNRAISRSEGLFGRERAKAAALCQATPSCQPASSQQAAFELVQTATSVQHPPSALDRFIARKRAGKGQTSVGQTSAPLQPVASPQGPSLGKAPTALERVNARHTAHVGAKALPSQHQALPAQAAAGAKHYTLYSDRVLDADASQHSQDTVLSQWHLIRKDTVPVALEQHTNSRQASALERTNAKLQARRDTRFLRPEATLTRLPDHQTTLDSLPSSTAARIGTFSQAAQVVDLPQQSTGPQMHATGVGRMRCDEISQRQQRHPAAAGPRHDLDSHHVLLSHKLKPRVGVKATAVLTDASNGVSSSGHGQLRSDSVIYPCLLDVSRDNDRMKPSGDKASTKQRKRMYQDIESDRPVSVADRLGIATSSKKLRQISQRCDTGCVQIVQDLGVFSRLGRQPIVI